MKWDCYNTPISASDIIIHYYEYISTRIGRYTSEIFQHFYITDTGVLRQIFLFVIQSLYFWNCYWLVEHKLKQRRREKFWLRLFWRTKQSVGRGFLTSGLYCNYAVIIRRLERRTTDRASVAAAAWRMILGLVALAEPPFGGGAC